jgi:hypothetical protein
MRTHKEIFVFAVCGDTEHIDTLNYSLKALRKYSDKPVIVVTDPARNKANIQHDNMVEVNTPVKFNNHQASIYLKTGLPQFLPAGNIYCYLDSDIVATDEQINTIFQKFVSPITFANDHCTMDEFSPYCVNCDCLENFQAELKLFRRLENEYMADTAAYKKTLALIDEVTAYNKRNLLISVYNTLRYYLSGKYYKLNDSFYQDKKTAQWLDANKIPLEEKFGIHRHFRQKLNLTWDAGKTTYLRENGKPFFELSCNHLGQNIQAAFGVTCTPPNWQHWNGGVFLFDDTSKDFLNSWHNDTLAIFENDEWKTRDQGTLIANAFKWGLNNHPTLDKRYNYIVDYTAQKESFTADMVCHTAGGEKIKPYFLHVFHHFGDTNWKFWRDLERYLNLPFS